MEGKKKLTNKGMSCKGTFPSDECDQCIYLN